VDNENSDGDDTALVAFRIIRERLRGAIAGAEEIDYRGVRDSRRTFLIGRASLFMVMLLTLPVFFLIWSLVGSMGTITDRMGDMKQHVNEMRGNFDEVSNLVAAIDASVVTMSSSIEVIPSMERRLAGMRGDFDAMTSAMRGITPNVTHIDRTLGIMDQDMAQMNYAFGFVNRDVFLMGRNVNQMSSPLRMIPFLGR